MPILITPSEASVLRPNEGVLQSCSAVRVDVQVVERLERLADNSEPPVMSPTLKVMREVRPLFQRILATPATVSRWHDARGLVALI